jgi:hypothetical protein
MIYIDYTIKDALRLFKEYLKERVIKWSQYMKKTDRKTW